MDNQKGLLLYLAIMIMGIILAIIFGISTILLVQLESIKGMENSVVAFCAAETGIERVLLDRIDPTVFNECTSKSDLCSLDNESQYYVVVNRGGTGTCPATKPLGGPMLFCIKSAGIYKGTQRSIEVRY